MGTTQAMLLTGRGPAAIAVILLAGPAAAQVLTALGVAKLPAPGRTRLADFTHNGQTLDQGLAVRIAPAAFELHLHGGPAIIQLTLEALTALSVHVLDPASPDAGALAAQHAGIAPDDTLAAEVFTTLPQAQTPFAARLLANQSTTGLAAWTRHWLTQIKNQQSKIENPLPSLWPLASAIHFLLDRSTALRRFLQPPRIALVGPPNAGKSTLANALLGRELSITHHEPGTTRDWVDASAILTPGPEGHHTSSPARPGREAPAENAGALREPKDRILEVYGTLSHRDLTESQAQFLLHGPEAQSLRDRVPAAEQSRDWPTGQREVPASAAPSPQAVESSPEQVKRPTPDSSLSWRAGTSLVVTLVDTAGIRGTPDPLEAESIARTHQQVRQADLLVAVLDATTPLDVLTEAWLTQVAQTGLPLVVAINKCDLVADPLALSFSSFVLRETPLPIIPVSALRRENLSELVTNLLAELDVLDASPEEPLAFTPRQTALLERAAVADSASAAEAFLEELRGPGPRLTGRCP